MGTSPGRIYDWKNWMASSAGVFGIVGDPEGEGEPDLERLGIEICLPYALFLPFAIVTDDEEA